MRSSKVPRALLVLVAGALALAIAFGLSRLFMQGKFVQAGLFVAGAAVGIGAICSMEIALLALLVVSFTDGFAKGIAPGLVSLLAKDALMLIGLSRWVWVGLTSQRWEALRLPLILPAFLFIIYCVAEMFNTETGSFLAALAGFRSWVVWMGVYVLVYEYVTTRRHVHRLLITIMLIALVTAVYGIVQYNLGFEHLQTLGPGFEGLKRFTWGEERIRALSTLVSPGAFGDATSLPAILCLGAVAYMRGKWWLKALFVLTAAVCFVGMATSGSRAPLLGLAVGGLSLLVLVRRPQLMFVTLVIGVGSIAILNSFAGGAFEARYNPKMVNYSVVVSRVTTPLRTGIHSVIERPLGVGVATGMGVGRGTQVFQQPIRVKATAGGMVENEYGRALRELGLPGTFLLVWLLYIAVKGTASSYLRTRNLPERSLVAACLGVAVSTVARLSVGSALYVVPSGPLFWIACALPLRVAEIEAQETEAMAALARREPKMDGDEPGHGKSGVAQPIDLPVPRSIG